MNSLSRQEMTGIIEGKRTTQRIPNLYSIWIYPGSFEPGLKMEEWLGSQVCDVQDFFLNMPALTADINPDFCYCRKVMSASAQGALDNRILVEDWADMEELLRDFPDPDYSGLIPEINGTDDKYILARWWYCLFERHWSLRGMENALTDFYLYPEEVHRLYRKLTDFYIRIIERIGRETCADGIFVSDDLGTQTGPFFSPEIFREFFKPYYKEIIDRTHEMGMHFWLHSCGNIELFMEDFIEVGLDVIHPIQKYTMDDLNIAEKYGARICILAGFDVQYTIPFGTVRDVDQEVRRLIETYARPEGRLMLTMGNGSTSDWKKESLEALYAATACYGDTMLDELLHTADSRSVS